MAVNLAIKAVPTSVKTVTATTAIKAAIKAYSMMVTPFWSLALERILCSFISFSFDKTRQKIHLFQDEGLWRCHLISCPVQENTLIALELKSHSGDGFLKAMSVI
jgi:hypothetical protein